jgi:hypothetical protein
MVQQVQLENGQIYEFPDDVTPQEMQAALAHIPAPSSDAANNNDMGMPNPTSDRLAAVQSAASSWKPPSIRDVAQGVVQGAVNAGDLINKGETGAVNALFGSHLKAPDVSDVASPIGTGRQDLSAKIARGLGSYLPYGAAGGSSILGQIIAGGASGAANTQPGEENLFGFLPKGKIGGSIEGAAANLLPVSVLKALEKARPANFLRGKLSPEELAKNLRAAGQTSTDLGGVLDSPTLKKRYENIITKLPFSNAEDVRTGVKQDIYNQGNELLGEMLGNENPENITDTIHKKLIKQFESHQRAKNQLYDKADQIADKDENYQLEPENFAAKARDYTSAIESMNFMQYEPDIQKIFNKASNYKNPVKETQKISPILDASGNAIKGDIEKQYPTLKEMNILRGRLSHYAKKAGQSPDPAQRNMANVYNDLSSSLKQDIDRSIEESGNEDLETAYQEAQENYKKNFSPFLDKQIYKFIGGPGESDLITQSFVKTGKSADRANLTSKLAKALGPKAPLLSYSYFSRALDNEGKLNPSDLSRLISNLGPRQFKALVPDEAMRTKLQDYKRLYKMNSGAVNNMANPDTGQKYLELGILHALGALSGAGGDIFQVPSLALRPQVLLVDL